MRFEIRPAAAGDIPALEALEAACFSDPWSESSLRGAVLRPEYTVLLAEENGRAAGYAVARVILDEAELLRIGTLPEYRGEGLGTALLQKLLAEISAAVWRLDVRAGNLPAQALYRRTGFREEARNRNFYEHPSEDGILMLLEQP